MTASSRVCSMTKIGGLIGPVFSASIESAVAAGDASRIGGDPLNLFWFAHHTVLMAALTRFPSVPCLSPTATPPIGAAAVSIHPARIGLTEAAIAFHLDGELSPNSGTIGNCRKCHDMNIVTEPKISGQADSDKPHKRPVRLVRWFLIVGLLLAAVVSGLGFFKFVFLPNLFKEIFSKAASAVQRQYRHGQVRNDSEPPDRSR